MDIEPTTDPGATEGAAVVAQPDAILLDEPAVVAPEEPTPTDPIEPTAPSADDNSDWLKNKGIDPTDPEAVAKLAKMARESEKAMHESTSKASNLEKSLKQDLAAAAASGDNELVSQLAVQVQNLTLTQTVNDFFTAGGNSEEAAARKAAEPAMAKIVTDDPNIGELVKQGYLSYDQLYAMARGSGEFAEKLKSDGGREALEQVAKKQQAKAVPGAATNSDLSGDSSVDPMLQAFVDA